MSGLAEFQEIFPEFTWDYTPDSLKERTHKLIQTSKSHFDRVIQLEDDNLNLNFFLKLYVYDADRIDRERKMIELMRRVCPIQKIRTAANECGKLLSNFLIEVEMRKDFYDILLKIREVESQLSPEHDRYLNKLLLDRRRKGLHLAKNKYDKLATLFKEINKLCREFYTNIAEDDFKIECKISDLHGIEGYFIESLIESDGSPIVILNSFAASPIMYLCRSVSMRQALDKAFNSRFNNSNVPILKKLIKLRHKCSQILGYETYVDYCTEILMSKNSQTVHEFLLLIIINLRNLKKREMRRLLELKRQECERFHIDFDGKINYYDLFYYQRIVEEIDFSVKVDIISEYFPLDHVKQQVMEIFQTLFHLRFSKIDGAQTWHPDVSLYSVCDSDDSRLLGFFYLDLFSRPGKYARAATFGLLASYKTEIRRQVPCVAMVVNFMKSTTTESSLLTHQQVETFFHEFGHVMHHICSIVDLSLFHAHSVEVDFFEVPSQMFENWAWEKECLKKISCHYQTKECLSDDLIDKLIKSRKANIAINYSQKLLFFMFDHIIHTNPHCDTFEVFKRASIDILGIEPTPGTNYTYAFEQMNSSYDAQFYSYLWSEVIAHDMFMSKFKKEGIFNPSTGLSFRKCILEPGSTQDPNDLFKKFLGRNPNQIEFLKHVGIPPSVRYFF